MNLEADRKETILSTHFWRRNKLERRRMGLLCLTHRITLSELRPMNEFLSIVRILILSWISLKNKIQYKVHLFARLQASQYAKIFQTWYFFLYSIWGTVLCNGWWLEFLREQTFLTEKGKGKAFLYSCSSHPHTCLPEWFKPLECKEPWSHNPNVDGIVPPENTLLRKCKLSGWEATTSLSLPNRRWKIH